MEIAQALVLSSSVRPDQPWASVRSTPKPLVPVANRPLLFHDLDALRAAGVRATTIAVEPGTAGVIRDAVGDGEDWDMTVRYAECGPHAPVAEALARSADLMAHEPVLVRHAGSLLRQGIHPHIAAFADERLDALALRTPRAPEGGHSDDDARDSSMMLSRRAVAILTADAAERDPLARIAAGGGHVRVQEVDGCLPCLGRQESLLEANRRVLAELTPSVDHDALIDSRVQGPVVIHPTAHVERSLVRGPAVIGPRARIVDSYVGPSTAIGAEVELEGAEVEYSIVLPGARLAFLGRRVEASVIGRGARVERSLTPPASLRLAVGEGAEIVLS